MYVALYIEYLNKSSDKLQCIHIKKLLDFSQKPIKKPNFW